MMKTTENEEQQLVNWQNVKPGDYQGHIRSKIVGYDVLHELMLHVSRAYKKPERLLIVGAGGGQELLVLGKAYPDAHFTALDPSQVMLASAQSVVAAAHPALSVDYYNQYLSQLKPEVAYDLAACQLVLHYVPTLEQKLELLQQLAACLHEATPLFISAIMSPPEEGQFHQQMAHWQQSMSYYGVSDEHWEKFANSFGKSIYPVTSEQLQQLLRQAGFTDIVPYFKSHLIEGYAAKKG